MAEFDLAIIGGGINGAGIARDAAGRGLSVLRMWTSDLQERVSITVDPVCCSVERRRVSARRPDQ